MKYIGYIRVSTKEQGRSGLSLEGQGITIKNYVKLMDGDLLASYSDEVSAFKKSKQWKRNGLLEALEHCKKEDAVLVVAKLDRLSRNIVQFFSLIQDSGIEFKFCDALDANTVTLSFYVSMAQQESETRSERLLSAYKAKRARLGVEKLELHGNSKTNLTNEGRQKAWKRNSEKAANNENNKRAMELIKMYKAEKMTLAAIAEKLNDNGFRTSTGKAFHKTTVSRLWKRSLAAAG